MIEEIIKKLMWDESDVATLIANQHLLDDATLIKLGLKEGELPPNPWEVEQPKVKVIRPKKEI